MTEPFRKNLVVHHRQEHDVYVGRPSKWGNPFSHTGGLAIYRTKTRLESIRKYRAWILTGEGKHLLKDLHELKGKVLGCWCAPMPCHAEVLVQLANGWKCPNDKSIGPLRECFCMKCSDVKPPGVL